MKNLKKILISIVFVFTLFFMFNTKILAKEVNVYIFHGKTCPHCHDAIEYLESIKDKYDLNIYKYEVWEEPENEKIMKDVAAYLDFNVRGVPFIIINDTPISGFDSNFTPETYRYHIKEASKEESIDRVGVKIGILEGNLEELEQKEKKLQEEKLEDKSFKITLPIIGKVDLKSISLPIVSIILGIIDGFNPCAMWVLLFLISTLIGMKNKKRLWVLGITFLVSSSFVYLAFMVSWLEFAKMISGVVIVRTIIAAVALTAGAINLNSFANSIGKDDGCNVVDAKKRKKIFARIKKFTHEKSFIFAILGTILLAFSVNLIELACSAGLPVIFTQLLAMNDLSTVEYAIYLLLYILFFMLDDLIIFAVAVRTMELTGISTKYSKYSHLIGGILMFIIGILLLVKPEWLMFNF